jgi:hypothetical protein
MVPNNIRGKIGIRQKLFQTLACDGLSLFFKTTFVANLVDDSTPSASPNDIQENYL